MVIAFSADKNYLANHLRVLIWTFSVIWQSLILKYGSLAAIYVAIKDANFFFKEKYAKEFSLNIFIFTFYYDHENQSNIKLEEALRVGSERYDKFSMRIFYQEKIPIFYSHLIPLNLFYCSHE